MKTHRLAFIDIEMTGFDVYKHEIIELGVVLVDQYWSNGSPVFKLVEEISIKVKPKNLKTADPISLKVAKYNEKDWENAISLTEALKIINKKTSDCIMVAHNICFDFLFLDKAFRDCEMKNTMHYLRIDTISMAFAKLHKFDSVEKYSLRSLCEYFQIRNENVHTALSDAKVLYELYQKLILL